jgi:hypothetical protein
MEKKRKSREGGDDKNALTPCAILDVDGGSLKLCFTFLALREAKMQLRARGINLNLLLAFSIGQIDADTLPELLFASLRTYHPEIDFESALSIISPGNMGKIVDAVAEAYRLSMEGIDDKSTGSRPPVEPKS